LKVGLVSGVCAPTRGGGVAEVVSALLNHLEANGIEVVLFTSNKQPNPHVRTHIVSKNPVRFPISLSLPRNQKALRECDLLNLQAGSALGLGLAKKLGYSNMPPVVTTFHVSPFREAKSVHGTRFEKGLAVSPTTGEYFSKYIKYRTTAASFYFELSASSGMTAVSSVTRKEIAEDFGIPLERIKVVHNGIDLEFVSEESHGDEKENPGSIILCVGVFRIRKGMHHLVRAASKIFNSHKDATIVFLGYHKGYERQLRKISRYFGVEESITYCGNVSRGQLMQWYRKATVVVVPSIYEGFPMVVLESLASGTPVVATRVGGIEEIVQNTKTGYLVDPNNSQSLADAIIMVLDDPKYSRLMARRGRSLIKKKFNWNHIAKKYIKVYEGVLGQQ